MALSIWSNYPDKGWCIKNETHVWASGAFIINFSEFLNKTCQNLHKNLFCSLIFIRVTWENVKIYIFYFFQICQKKLQEITKLQYINFRGSKASITQFWNLFIKCKNFLSFHAYFLFVALFLSELQGKIWDINYFNTSTSKKNSIMYCNINVQWF